MFFPLLKSYSCLVAYSFALEVFFFCSLYLLFAMLIVIVYILLNFWFYWFGLMQKLKKSQRELTKTYQKTNKKTKTKSHLNTIQLILIFLISPYNCNLVLEYDPVPWINDKKKFLSTYLFSSKILLKSFKDFKRYLMESRARQNLIFHLM